MDRQRFVVSDVLWQRLEPLRANGATPFQILANLAA